ncbi:hypothetical protein CAC42_57 [Sphaceloma murrayae]|uniref:Uncharacterized protein n=1 Tax=Sphaceloma murrayae TaxID=2082308 RepID=A0A2K1QN57_9PEZI|nr:hypothetical protein CAC42_57 [Sphaceloma murrayae]
MTPVSRIKFFTGAPTSSQLVWDMDALPADVLPAFRSAETACSEPAPTLTSSLQVNWRSVILDGRAFIQTPRKDCEFHDTLALKSTLLDDVTDDFIEHSLAVLDKIESSQLAQHPGDDSTIDDDTTASILASFPSTDGSSVFAECAAPAAASDTFIRGPITPLSNLPLAKHLLRLQPQTITVNLIVGIISVTVPRTVYVRKGDYEMEVLEITVADETKAGFSITVWLSPIPSPAAKAKVTAHSALRETVAALRSGDVVCVSRLALAAYNGQVYGQTLNRRASGIITSFSKVDTDRAIGQDMSSDLKLKIEKVAAWVDRFVGMKTMGATRKRKTQANGLPETGISPRKVPRLQQDWLPDDSPS